jgi:hypothetical protein
MPAAKKTPAKKAANKPSTAVVVRPTTALATPGSWRERAKQSINTSRQTLAKLPQMGGNFLSFRGGVISAGGNQIANPLPLVLLAHGFERTYYSKPFNPDATESPDCYSYDGDRPHEKSAVPQSDTCAQCRLAEFGSAPNGKGKACREGARLAFIHGDVLAKGPAAIQAATIWQARLSVLNAKTFRSYIEAIFGDEEPCWSKLTTLENRPDPKSQYAVSFIASVFEGEALLDAIAARVDEADRLMVMPYPEFDEAPPAKASTPPRRGRKF